MDTTVPKGAALLLVFIYETETKTVPPACYDVIYGHNQDKLPKPLTSMTLAEVQKAQSAWTKRFKSSAAGAAQFMRATLNKPGVLKFLGPSGVESIRPGNPYKRVLKTTINGVVTTQTLSAGGPVDAQVRENGMAVSP